MLQYPLNWKPLFRYDRNVTVKPGAEVLLNEYHAKTETYLSWPSSSIYVQAKKRVGLRPGVLILVGGLPKGGGGKRLKLPLSWAFTFVSIPAALAKNECNCSMVGQWRQKGGPLSLQSRTIDPDQLLGSFFTGQFIFSKKKEQGKPAGFSAWGRKWGMLSSNENDFHIMEEWTRSNQLVNSLWIKMEAHSHALQLHSNQ